MISIITRCSSPGGCRGHNPEKERIQCGGVCPGYRKVADQRRVPVLVKQEHRNAIHHFLLLKRGVQIKRLVHVALNQVHIGGQPQRRLARVLRNLLARPAPRRSQLEHRVVRRLRQIFEKQRTIGDNVLHLGYTVQRHGY